MFMDSYELTSREYGIFISLLLDLCGNVALIYSIVNILFVHPTANTDAVTIRTNNNIITNAKLHLYLEIEIDDLACLFAF